MKQDLKYITLRSKNTKELIKLVRFEFNLAKRKKKIAILYDKVFLDNDGYFNQVIATFRKG